MTTLLSKIRKARKRHRCIWCPEPILPGEKYLDERAIFSRDFQALKYHPECREACTRMARELGGDFDLDPHGSKRGSTEEI